MCQTPFQVFNVYYLIYCWYLPKKIGIIPILAKWKQMFKNIIRLAP